MTISSRTPDGQPNRCPICGKAVTMQQSLSFRDAPCPHCGCLLHFNPDLPHKKSSRETAKEMIRLFLHKR
jgi:hypothetical protein